MKQITAPQRTARLGIFILTLVGFSAPAGAQSLFGGTGRMPYRDITGSPEVAGLSLDYSYIAGETPSYAELRGLAGAPTVEVRRNYVYVRRHRRVADHPVQDQ
jgi:hypothetical protein